MKVVVAVITDKEQRILITKRPTTASHPGLWEFPGGKVEQHELVTQALVREIQEEVGLTALNFSFLTEINHQYPERTVCLQVYHVSDFSGEAKACESQLDLRWVPVESLSDFQFPEANLQIINLLRC